MKKTLFFTLLAVVFCAKGFGQTIGTEIEPNDNYSQANLLVLGSYAANQARDTGCHLNGTQDFYKVRISQPGVLITYMPANSVGCYIDIVVIDSATNNAVNDFISTSPLTNEALICGGTYYIRLYAYTGSPTTSPYSLQLSFYPDAIECNDTKFTAYTVHSGDIITGHLWGKYYQSGSRIADVDYYKIRNTECGFLTAQIPINATGISFSIGVSDSATGLTYPTHTSASPGGAVTDTLSIPHGTYYIKVSSYSANTDSNPYSLNINLTHCLTGVQELTETTENINVYPNPNNGNFTVRVPSAIDKATITIDNLLGQKVKSIMVDGDAEIPVSIEQASGIYILTITTTNNIYTQKIFINN